MANVIEYLIRLRDEFSQKLRDAQRASGDASRSILSDALAIGVGIARMKDKVSAGFDVLTGDYRQLGDLLGMLPGPIGEIGQVVGDTLGGILSDTVEAAEGFRRLSAATGASVEFLSGFTEVADDMRVGVEVVKPALENFAKGLGGIEDSTEGVVSGGKGAAGVLVALGISARDAHGKLRPMEDVLFDVADAFQKMPDGPQKSAIAVQLFGRAGAQLIPILNQGAEAMRANMEAARSMGLVYTRDTVQAVDQLKAAQDSLGDSVEGVKRQIGSVLVPELARYMAILSETNAKNAETPFIFERMKNSIEAWVTALTGGEAESARLTRMQAEQVAALENTADAMDANTEATKESEAAARALAEAQAELERRTRDVIGAVSGETEAMNEVTRVKTALRLATGDLTFADFEREQAVKAVMKALKDKQITEDEAVTTLKQLSDGTISSEDAMKRAGGAADAFRKEMRDLEASARTAKAHVAGLGASMNTLQSRDVTLTARGQVDQSFVTMRTTYDTPKDSSIKKTAQGQVDQSYYTMSGVYASPGSTTITKTAMGNADGSWWQWYGGGGTYNSIYNTSATKFAAGNKDWSWDSVFGPYGSWTSVYSQWVIKTARGQVDQSFVNMANYWNSVYGAIVKVGLIPSYYGNMMALGKQNGMGGAARSRPESFVVNGSPITIQNGGEALAKRIAMGQRMLARHAQLRMAMGG